MNIATGKHYTTLEISYMIHTLVVLRRAEKRIKGARLYIKNYNGTNRIALYTFQHTAKEKTYSNESISLS